LNELIIKKIISTYHIVGRAVYGIFVSMLKEIETLDVLLMTWKKYGGNQCNLVVISRI
jgi:hypothetical protein